MDAWEGKANELFPWKGEREKESSEKERRLLRPGRMGDPSDRP